MLRQTVCCDANVRIDACSPFSLCCVKQAMDDRRRQAVNLMYNQGNQQAQVAQKAAEAKAAQQETETGIAEAPESTLEMTPMQRVVHCCLHIFR